MNKTDVIVKKKNNDFLKPNLKEEGQFLSAIIVVSNHYFNTSHHYALLYLTQP